MSTELGAMGGCEEAVSLGAPTLPVDDPVAVGAGVGDDLPAGDLAAAEA